MDFLDPAQFSRLVLWIVATCWSELEPILLPGTGWEGATIVIDNLVLCKTFSNGMLMMYIVVVGCLTSSNQIICLPLSFLIRTAADLAKELGQADILAYLSSIHKT